MTGICVVYNTKDLFQRAYESVRKFHPGLDMLIIDGSSESDPCFDYVRSLRSEATIYQFRNNVGHGPGMNIGLEKCKDDEALIFDSDIVMLRSPLSGMLSLMTRETYGVGWITEIGSDGFDYGTFPGHFREAPIPYLHPYFMILNVKQYFRFPPFINHGAPCFQAMKAIHEKGLSRDILGNFLTGHTSGEGINWKGRPNPYIQHDFGGTRTMNKNNGEGEVPGKWQR